MLNHEKLLSQLSSAKLKLSSAALCDAVRCRALPCGTVPCCAVLSFEHLAVPDIMRYPIPTGMYVRVYSSFFRVLHLISSLGPPLFFGKLYPHWRSERDIANNHTQHSTGQPALRICSSWHYQIDNMCTKSWPLLSAAFAFGSIFPCASVAGGVGRPRSGALVRRYGNGYTVAGVAGGSLVLLCSRNLKCGTTNIVQSY